MRVAAAAAEAAAARKKAFKFRGYAEDEVGPWFHSELDFRLLHCSQGPFLIAHAGVFHEHHPPMHNQSSLANPPVQSFPPCDAYMVCFPSARRSKRCPTPAVYF